VGARGRHHFSDATTFNCEPLNFIEYAFHKVLILSPTLSVSLGRRRLTQSGNAAQIVLYFGYCIELQDWLKSSEEVNF
jgi:hypothetical protein